MDALKQAIKEDWSQKSRQEALKAFETAETGLSQKQADERLGIFGINEIAKGKPTPWYVLIARQFSSPLIYILLAAAVITAFMKHYNDVIIIMTVLILNAAIGFHQERKAERAINNIKGMSAPKCRVRREERVFEINASELVPGDLVLLEEGDLVPADGRIMSVSRLQIEEAVFTGETIASSKSPDILGAAAVLAEKTNMAFMGTHVISGRGELIVTATAMNSELGKIADMVQKAEEILTPLQKKLEDFSRFVINGVLGICAVIFISSHVIYGQNFQDVLLNAIALAVSAIPEGLPVIITLVLAVGVRRMAGHKALIRKLPTVETLGSATVICTDKTGTLTRNEMVAVKLFTADREYEVTGEGYSCEGRILPIGEGTASETALQNFMETAVLCNNASLKKEGNDWRMFGDATEGALMALAGKFDSEFPNLRQKIRRHDELPFDSRIKYMITIHESDSGLFKAHLKGSMEAVMAKCTTCAGKSGVREMTDSDRSKFHELNSQYAGDALRVLGLAVKNLPQGTNITGFLDSEPEGYTFLGIVGLIDLPRPEAIDAIKKCRKAGIKVVMITGDHAATALAVGKKVGLIDEGMKVLTGADLNAISDEDLKKAASEVAIYARTTPEDKMRIILALQNNNHIVSMTGDGVNDAPALTRADIGVAMGKSGTDIAREAAGMILVDDNFASIVNAVEEGRIIFNNLRKAISFLVSTNVGEVLTLLVASLLGMPAPLRAVQILWVNLVTDGCTSIALGLEPPEGDEMDKKPRMPGEPLLSYDMRIQVAVVSTVMCLGVLGAYKIGMGMSDDLNIRRQIAETMAFGTIVFFQLFNIFNCRSYEKSLFQIGLLGNKTLVGAVLLALILQFSAMFVPFMMNLFGIVALNLNQTLWVLGISFLVIPAVELAKLLKKPN